MTRSTGKGTVADLQAALGKESKKVFKFEGLRDLSDLAEKGDFAVSYDLKSGYYHGLLEDPSRRA